MSRRSACRTCPAITPAYITSKEIANIWLPYSSHCVSLFFFSKTFKFILYTGPEARRGFSLGGGFKLQKSFNLD